LNRLQKALQEGENVFANEMTTGDEDDDDDDDDVDTSTAGQNKATVLKLQREIVRRDMQIDKLKKAKKIVIKKSEPKKRKVLGWRTYSPKRLKRDKGGVIGTSQNKNLKMLPTTTTKKTPAMKRSPVQTRTQTAGKRRLSYGTPLHRSSYPSSTRK
jgi:hypothetical protein